MNNTMPAPTPTETRDRELDLEIRNMNRATFGVLRRCRQIYEDDTVDIYIRVAASNKSNELFEQG